jgi:hypothetical protein
VEKLDGLFGLYAPDEIEFHYGDCTGADAISFEMARVCGFYTIAHPPKVDRFRAFTSHLANESREPKDYSARNRDIVDETSSLLVIPATMAPVLRSGTWSTYNYAKSLERPVHIFWPDGSIGFD